ncbi:MAG: hypothetical protein D6767_07425 [Candidatus Hydrogenedentota bacterium]|nr:MAG: hypothetical protein D6767_07425 [Candidatus Hydrogenedentota bacterium]
MINLRELDRKWQILWGVLGVLGLIGLGLRLTEGLKITNLTSYVSWGLWIAFDIYFVGLSAGSFLLSSMIFIFRLEKFERIGRLALFTALVTLICALTSAWFDIGHMERFYKVFLYPHFSSMMVWVIFLYSLYFIVLLLELRLVLRKELVALAAEKNLVGKIANLFLFGNHDTSKEALEKDEQTLRKFGMAGVPLALGFHGGMGALFGVVAANPYWHSAVTPIYFVIGALLSGVAFLCIVLYLFWEERDAYFEEVIKSLKNIVLGLLIVDFIFEWAEFSIAFWGGNPEHTVAFKLILFGPYWYVFWIFHLGLGVFLPVYLLSKKESTISQIVTACALIAVTFMAVRLNIVIPGLSFERFEGIENAFVQPRLSFHYMPSLEEWLASIFVIWMGLTIFYLGARYFPLLHSENSSSGKED